MFGGGVGWGGVGCGVWRGVAWRGCVCVVLFSHCLTMCAVLLWVVIVSPSFWVVLRSPPPVLPGEVEKGGTAHKKTGLAFGQKGRRGGEGG